MADCASVVGVQVTNQKLLTEEGELAEIEARLGILHEKVVNFDSDQSMIWDRDPEEASEFLQVIDEIRQLVDRLITSSLYNKLLCYADSTLQMAMSRLEDEFVHLLRQYKQPLEPEHMSFRSVEDELSEDFSYSSFEEEAIQGRSQHDSSRKSEDFVVDLIHPDVLCDLRSIAETMFVSKYDKECCQAYISVRKDALDECLSVLRIEKLSIEEVLQLEWASLNSMIKRWNRALKVFVRVYLSSESRLCDLIFAEFSVSLRQTCFVEICKSSIMQFLNLGEAIAVGPLKPEKLFRILDMYEGLADLLTDIELLFPNESGSFVVNECNEILSRLGEYVRGTFFAFKNAIRQNTSTTGFAGGGVHPLTKYVMNYIKALADYSVTMNMLLGEENGLQEEANGLSPMTTNLQSVTSILESNLTDRSMLYVDAALQSLFLMNNICYMVQKVKDSDLQPIFGDNWIRSHNRKFTQHATNYERASWNPVLLFLKDEGIINHGCSTPSKTVLKERFKRFNQAFEEIYRTQINWSVPYVDLREDLRISISLKVLQAYRTFIGRYASHLDAVRHREHYIKYYPEDLELALLDLFEGSSSRGRRR
ncbi:exocyst complex component EXO70B1 [Phalaenopsis equestris]|uniref:exocyst complex component EXO70B1 n=1 Tax=Phalaenopsis equestris TaxID=78828 RepID=UPI0009E22386|nr:exocyst complex component EXO70B1 [Phalaenopsis equestris]XP_020591150.1 exocyst complex component EXO70B1 [Phalaenopsis equestris]XP_020591151.1 exocyst complex component EXO70B1 [Phalaenopsis equestris]